MFFDVLFKCKHLLLIVLKKQCFLLLNKLVLTVLKTI